MSDDGFVVIRARTGGRPPLVETVTFSKQNAAFSSDLVDGVPRRATWHWNRNGTLRARFSDDGRLSAYPVGHAGGVSVSACALYTALGRPLAGRYHATRDGNDIYISIATEDNP